MTDGNPHTTGTVDAMDAFADEVARVHAAWGMTPTEHSVDVVAAAFVERMGDDAFATLVRSAVARAARMTTADVRAADTDRLEEHLFGYVVRFGVDHYADECVAQAIAERSPYVTRDDVMDRVLKSAAAGIAAGALVSPGMCLGCRLDAVDGLCGPCANDLTA